VIPGLIRRIHQAKENNAQEVTVWGTGDQQREFLASSDCADACVFLMNLPEKDFLKLIGNNDRPPTINIGSGWEFTIRELAALVAKIVGYSGKIVFDSSKPDGTPRKLLDSSRLRNLGWSPKIDLQSGLEHAYKDFLSHKDDYAAPMELSHTSK
jgi:GDP-L-fucose synthase